MLWRSCRSSARRDSARSWRFRATLRNGYRWPQISRAQTCSVSRKQTQRSTRRSFIVALSDRDYVLSRTALFELMWTEAPPARSLEQSGFGNVVHLLPPIFYLTSFLL